MSGPFGSSQWMYSSGAAFYPTEIDQSLRFNDDDSAYLSRTPASAGNRKTWTWSGWVKRGNIGGNHRLFAAGADTDDTTDISFGNGDLLQIRNRISSTNTYRRQTNMVFRDVSAWYHIFVVFDTTQSTADDRLKLYVNGLEITSWDVDTIGSQNEDTFVSNATPHYIGVNANISSSLDGYLAEVNFIDGQALDPTDFGEFKSGVWVAKSYAGSYGTNGFYLNFSDSANIGDDLSGNANDWTANNLVATDVVLDSPTQNWCVLNSTNTAGATLSEGNLKYVSASSGYTPSVSTFGNASGKWYWEVNFVSGSFPLIGVVDETWSVTSGNAVGYLIGPDGVDSIAYYSDGRRFINGSGTSYGASFTTGDIIGVALDLDSNEITFYKNGVSQGAISYTFSGNFILPAVSDASNSNTATLVANFGQDSSFAGNKTAQGNTDANGIGDFYYAPPSGFLALNAQNLPTPAIDPAQDDVPADYFDISLWTGNGNSQDITGLTFQPDWVWIKDRSNGTYYHILQDSIRGTGVYLASNATDADTSNSTLIQSFDADGFSLGTGLGVNKSGDSYVGWSWLAGNGTSSNSDGSITSTVSVNQKAGFSIISATSPASGNFTVGHGLTKAPEFVIVKDRNSGSYYWPVYHAATMTSVRNFLRLNTTDAQATSGGDMWGSAFPTSSVIGLSAGNVAATSNPFICYAFHSVEGYSKFGSYTGNGSTDGPFVYCGFRPAWIMVKRTDGVENWGMVDQARSSNINPMDDYLIANASDAEVTGSAAIEFDFLSNGFKVREDGAICNASGGTYIYMAFAEMPAKYSLAR
jgi:hypothetical protein